jgi:hypothetical protein
VLESYSDEEDYYEDDGRYNYEEPTVHSDEDEDEGPDPNTAPDLNELLNDSDEPRVSHCGKG